MPTSKSHRPAPEDRGRRGKLPKKASSFHGRVPPAIAAAKELRRPMTAPELLPPASLPEPRPRLTKLLLNVTVLGGVGAVQVVMSPESTVGDLVAAVVRQYAKEGRRPTLASDDASRFDLHYSQFSLESLDKEEKLMALGSRNFFVCPRKALADGPAEGNAGGGGDGCGGGGYFVVLSRSPESREDRFQLVEVHGLLATVVDRSVIRLLSWPSI